MVLVQPKSLWSHCYSQAEPVARQEEDNLAHPPMIGWNQEPQFHRHFAENDVHKGEQKIEKQAKTYLKDKVLCEL